VAAQVLVESLYDSLLHVADFARLDMTKRLPCHMCILLMVGAIDKRDVKVWIESQVRRCALHDCDCAALGVIR
jgi:hypothetical protein